MVCPVCGCDIEKYSDCCPNCGTPVLTNDKKNSTRKKTLDKNLNLEQFPDSSAPSETLSKINDFDISQNKKNDDKLPSENITALSDKTNDRIENEDTKSSDEKFNTDKYSNIPFDMDLGKTTRYLVSQRKTPQKPTYWKKLELKYRPPRDSEPQLFSEAAKRNVRISVLLNILAIIGFVCGFSWAMNPFATNFLLGFVCPVATVLVVISIDCADTAATYYEKDYNTYKKKCHTLKLTSRIIFWIDLFMSAVVIAYQLFLMTGFLQAKDKNFILW